jgi:hypothetical protein
MASNSNRQVFRSKEVKVSRQESMNTIGCPFKVLSGIECSWVGSPSEALVHSIDCHSAEVQENSGPFAVQLQNFSEYKNFHRAILTLDKLFYLLWVIKEDTVHFLVYVIPKHTSEEYAYDFKLRKGQEQIAMTGGACGRFLHHESKVLETGDIVRLPCSTVQNFVDENGGLSCIIEIRSKEATAFYIEVLDTSDVESELLSEVEDSESEHGSSEEEPEPLANEYQCPVPAN